MEANLGRKRTSVTGETGMCVCVCVCARASAFQLFNKRPPLFCDFKRAGPLAAFQSLTQTERLKGPIVDTRADFFKLSSKNSTENYCWVNIVLLLVFKSSCRSFISKLSSRVMTPGLNTGSCVLWKEPPPPPPPQIFVLVYASFLP